MDSIHIVVIDGTVREVLDTLSHPLEVNVLELESGVYDHKYKKWDKLSCTPGIRSLPVATSF